MAIEEVWGLIAILGDYFSPCQEGISLQLGPSLFCPRPISALHPCPGGTRIEASFSPFFHSHSSHLVSPSCFVDPYGGSLENLFSQPTIFCSIVSLRKSRSSFLSSSLCQPTGCLHWHALPKHTSFASNFNEITFPLLFAPDQFGEL